MATVPLSRGPQLNSAVQQGGYLPQIDAGNTGRLLTHAAGAVSDAAQRHVAREEEIATSQADAAVAGGWLQKDAELRKQYQGANVDQYQAEAEKWWKDAALTYGKDLTERGKATLGAVLGRRQAVALGGVAQYANGEKERAADDAAQANIITSIQFGVTSGDVAGASARVRQLAAEVGARKGWTTEQVMAEQGKSLSQLHLAQISKLAETNATAAQTYYDANKAEVSFTQQPRIEQILKGSIDNQFATQFAAGVAAKPLAEQLTAAADIKDHERREKAITQIKTNHGLVLAAKQEQERQFSDQAWHMVGKGVKVPEVILAGMDGRERVQLQDHLRQRAEHLATLGAKPLPTDPTIHAKLWEMLTRDPEAFKNERLPAYSMKLSPSDYEQLSQAQQKLMKPGAIIEAKIDSDDFKHVAETMGLDPFNTRKAPDHERRLGELRFRVEQLINVAQQAKKQALTRDEKMALMQGELARQVTVNPGIFSFSKQMPVIQLSPDDARSVVVPDADKAKISNALKAMYATDPKNPAYAPTEDNVRRLYLARQSRAAVLISPPKQ